MPQISKIEVFKEILSGITYEAKFMKAVDNLPTLSYNQRWFSRSCSLSLPHSLQNTIVELLRAKGEKLTERRCGEELFKLCEAYFGNYSESPNASIKNIEKIAKLILKHNLKSRPDIIGTGYFHDVISEFKKNGLFSNSRYTEYSEIKFEEAKIKKSFDILASKYLKNSQKKLIENHANKNSKISIKELSKISKNNVYNLIGNVSRNEKKPLEDFSTEIQATQTRENENNERECILEGFSKNPSNLDDQINNLEKNYLDKSCDDYANNVQHTNLESLKEEKSTISYSNLEIESSFIKVEEVKTDLITQFSGLLSKISLNGVDAKGFKGSHFNTGFKVITQIFEDLKILKINRKSDNCGLIRVSFEGRDPYTVSGEIYEGDYGGFIKISYKNKSKEDKCIEIIADNEMSRQGNFNRIRKEHFDKTKYNLVEIFTGSNPQHIDQKDIRNLAKQMQKIFQRVPHAKPISIVNDNNQRFVTDPKGESARIFQTDPIVPAIINSSEDLDDFTKKELIDKSKYKYNYTGDQAPHTMSCIPIGAFRIITNVLNFIKNDEIESVINKRLNDIIDSKYEESKYVEFYNYFSKKYFAAEELFKKEYENNNGLVKDEAPIEALDSSILKALLSKNPINAATPLEEKSKWSLWQYLPFLKSKS